MKKTAYGSRIGFTLIELIVTLVLVGIISVFAGAAILSAVRGMVEARDNAETAQKVHLAVNRISRDLLVATNIVSGSSQSIVFDTLLPSGGPVRQTLSYANGILTLRGKTLLNGLASFQIFYIRYASGGSEVAENSYSTSSRGVEIRLTRTGSSVTYSDRVFPRNAVQNRGML